MSAPDRLVALILRRNRAFAALLLLALAGLAAAIPRLEISANSRLFFNAENAEFAAVREIEASFTQANMLLVMLVPPEGTTFSVETLTALQAMTQDAWQIPYTLRVDSPTNHMHSEATEDELYVEPMLDEFNEVTQEALDRFRDLALNDNALPTSLLSEDRSAYGLSIRVVLPDGNPRARIEVETALREMRDQWLSRYPGWEVRLSGGLLGNNLLARVALEDIYTLVPIALVAVVALFVVAMGSIVPVAASVVVLISATLATFGYAGWAGTQLTAGTAISPLAVMVLVSTSCVHINMSWARACEAGLTDDAFTRALEENLVPVTVSHVTTALGFLCLNFAPSPPLAAMGNMVAFGVLFGLFAVVIILPLLLAARGPERAGRFLVPAHRMVDLARWIMDRPRLWLTLFPLCIVLSIFGIRSIDYDDNVIRYFDERYELRQDAEAIASQLTGLDGLWFAFRAPEGDSVFEPDFLRRVDRFAEWLSERPEVVGVSTITNILKNLHRDMSGGGPEETRIADTQEGNAQLLMFYEMSLPAGLDLNNSLDVDRTRTLVTASVRVPHSSDLRALADAADAWLAENEPGFETRSSGMAIAFARISQRNNSQMIWGFLTALALVSCVLMLTLRSTKYGLLSLVPNLVPAILAFGFWGVAIGDVNLGSTVVTTMTFGIVVDDTVHFLTHYLRCRRRGMPYRAAIEDTFAVVGSAIVLTTVALILGFSTLAVSGFAINQHIGILTSVVIFFALIADLFFLPAVLARVNGDRKDALSS